jgi:hypothetical protein
LRCMHHLSTYTHLMAKEAGLNLDEYPIRDECLCPEDKGTWLQDLERRMEHRHEVQGQPKATTHSK